MSDSSLSLDSIVAAADHVSVADMGEEVLIFEYDSGTYYGVEGVGARIWQLIGQPRPVRGILTVLLDEYDVDAAQCERDLLAFLSSLLDTGAITIRDGRPGATP